jgi:hypothetical protein
VIEMLMPTFFDVSWKKTMPKGVNSVMESLEAARVVQVGMGFAVNWENAGKVK